MTDMAQDITVVLQNIKKEVLVALQGEKAMTIPVELCSAKKADNSVKPILYSDELNYLNANWANSNPVTELSSHRTVMGAWIVSVKRLIINFFWNNLFRSYFEHEREFNMHLVRHLNDSARYIDARDKELFWQIIQKLDNDVQMLTERVDYLFSTALATAKSTEQESEEGITQISNELEELKVCLSSIKSRLM
jgi:hypothetical protein